MISHATTTNRCGAETVQVLRQALHPPQIHFQARGHRGIQTPRLLLPTVHGRWNGQRNHSEPAHDKARCQEAERQGTVRDMRKTWDAHSPHRSKSRQQCPAESKTTLHQVSSPSASKGCPMQTLREAGYKNCARSVSQALLTIPQVGTSRFSKAESEYRPANSFGLAGSCWATASSGRLRRKSSKQ